MQRALLPGTWSKSRFAFGGSLLKGSHAKTKRVFSPKLPLHVVLKSSQARGGQSLLLHSKRIAQILAEQSARHHVRLLQIANAGNHLHLLLEAPSREHLSNFLRAISGRIAQLVLERALPARSEGQHASSSVTDDRRGFWDARPFSRIVTRGRELQNVARYLGMNSTEMKGLGRTQVRGIFAEIAEALKNGWIPHTPGLVAAGFT